MYGINANIKVQYNVDKKFDYFKEKEKENMDIIQEVMKESQVAFKEKPKNKSSSNSNQGAYKKNRFESTKTDIKD